MENNREQELISVAAIEDTGVNTITATKANKKVNVDWANNFGGKGSDEGFGVDVDKEGNIYVTGSFQDAVSFGDIKLESKGSSDAFVAKLDQTGKVLWAKNNGGASLDEANSIAVDDVGNSYITGSFKGTSIFGNSSDSEQKDDLEMVAAKVEFDGENKVETQAEDTPASNPPQTSISLDSNGSEDIFVAKLDNSGKVEWAKNFGGDSLDYGEGISVDKSGNTYITGSFFKSASFGSEFNFTSDTRNSFVAKLDEKGEVDWAKNFTGKSNRGYGITVDESGNTYVIGRFKGTVNFNGKSLTSSTDNDDVFIAKLDDTGKVEWAEKFGGTSDDRGYDVAVDKTGNTYITGYFKRTATFGDTTLKSNGSSDGFVAKLDETGKVKWAKKFGGSASDESFGISVDEAENIYLTGSFEDKINFGDTTLTSAGGKDAFIAKLNNMGMVKWAKKLGSNSVDEGFDIAVNSDNAAYVTGTFQNTAEIDDTKINSTAQKDAFLVKVAEEIPEISLAVTPLSIAEDGDSKLTYTFTRTGGNTDPLTVNFMVAGDAVFNQDYTQTGADSFSATEGTITFDTQQTTATIEIDATDDKAIEEDETIKLTLVAAKEHKEDKDKETPTDDEETLEKRSEEATEEKEVAPEDVGKLMQATTSDYNVATASEVMATITNDDTQSNGGSNSGDDDNSGGSNNSGGEVNTNLATKISNTNKTFMLDGDSAKIKFLLKRGKAGSVNEIALFKVDDEQGSINGVNPDDANYAEVASQNATRVFSALGDPPKGFSTSLNRIIELDNGKNFRLLMVKNGTLDGLRNGSVNLSQVLLSSALKVSDAGENNFDLGFLEDANSDEDITVQMQLDNQAMKPIGTNLQDEPEGEVIDLRGLTSKQTATFTVNREAEYDNVVGFYKITDVDGGIDTDNDGVADVLTTDADYATAAIDNRVAGIDLRVTDAGTTSITGEFEPGSIFAPFLIVDGTVDELVDNNSNNDPEIFFPYISANSDNVDHVRMLGDNIFGFEDLPQGGDNDFNDIVVSIEFS